MIEKVNNFQVDTCLSCGLLSESCKFSEIIWKGLGHVIVTCSLSTELRRPFFGECLTYKIDPSSICRGVSCSGKITDKTSQCKNAVFRNILVTGEIQDDLPKEETTESPNLPPGRFF